MPKLDQNIAKQVNAAQEWSGTGGRVLLEEGRYAGRLFKVEEKGAGPSGYGRWTWHLTKIHDAEGTEYPGRQFYDTSLSPKALGKFRNAFEAFGYTPDSDTDEILGEWVGLYVTQEIQRQGKNAGNTVNVVASLFPFEASEWDFDPSQVSPDEERNSGSAAQPNDDTAF